MPAPCKLTFDLESGVRVTCDVGYLCAVFNLPRHLCSVASEAICKWGGTMPARSAGRKIFDVPPHFSLVPPT